MAYASAGPQPAASRKSPSGPHHSEDALLESLGYRRQLNRRVNRFGSFSVAFALISVTTAVYTSFGLGLTTAGPAFLWTFPIAVGVVFLWVLIAADLSSKIPLAGYAYQWTSRLVSPHLGWFTGFFGVIGFVTAMASVAYALSGYLAGLLHWNLGTSGTVGVTILVLAGACLINIFGVKVVTNLNSMGVVLELVVALGGTAAIAIAAFFVNHNAQPVSFLFTTGTVPTSGYAIAWITATVTGLFGLVGAEAAADIAEETKKATSTVPRMMIFALGSASIVEFLMYGVGLLAIQNMHRASASPVPLIYIMETQLGPVFTDVFIAFALTNLLLCVLANFLVAGRLIFSMGRDGMLPKSAFFSRIGANKVPRNAVITAFVIAVICILTALLSPTVLGFILGVSTITFFTVYVLTSGGLIVGFVKHTYPADRPGAFSLGRWRGPVLIVGFIAFLIVTVVFSVVPGYTNNGIALLAFVAIAALWYFIGVRGRLHRGVAGPPTMRIGLAAAHAHRAHSHA